MGKSSQRKGRQAELEIASILRAAGFDAVACGIYETLDVCCAIDGHDRLLEVKRKKQTQGDAYTAIEAGAWGLVSRADRKPWLLTIPLRTFLELAGERSGADIAAVIDAGESGNEAAPEGATPSPRSTLDGEAA
jgi:hypothetical protein